jgi:hypothetical protein
MGRKQQKRDCSRRETDLIKMSDIRRIGKYKNTMGAWMGMCCGIFILSLL